MLLRKGFSLVELMIVVAIIGILAAIAIPNFLEMQLKAKRGEVPGNVDGIKTSEMSYEAAFDGYLTLTALPSTAPGKTMRAFTASTTWISIGWQPDGQVRGSYAATSAATDFTVSGSCDVDGDGSAFADYSATKTTNATLATADQNAY